MPHAKQYIRTGREKIGYLGPPQGMDVVVKWLDKLTNDEALELFIMLLDLPANVQDNEIALDWVEEHGGQRWWVSYFIIEGANYAYDS